LLGSHQAAIEFLKLLSHQAAISIDHAKLFKQTIDHSLTLEETVSAKTKELQLVVEELRVHATIDSMTGLNNRRYFFELSTNMFYKSKKTKESLHAFVLDIDKFKQINDTYGHSVGDQAIKLFAKSIEVFNDEKCILGRLGGDEFVLLSLGKDDKDICDFVDEIKLNIDNIQLKYANTDIVISASIGVASLSDNINSLDELILEADSAMYLDKNDKNQKSIRSRS
jgi:diguanylate cyclase (GGDEF)-like protein